MLDMYFIYFIFSIKYAIGGYILKTLTFPKVMFFLAQIKHNIFYLMIQTDLVQEGIQNHIKYELQHLLI